MLLASVIVLTMAFLIPFMTSVLSLPTGKVILGLTGAVGVAGVGFFGWVVGLASAGVGATFVVGSVERIWTY